MEALSIRAESGEGLLTSGKPKHRENSADRDALAGSGSGPWKMRTSRPIFDREEAVAGACRKVPQEPQEDLWTEPPVQIKRRWGSRARPVTHTKR